MSEETSNSNIIIYNLEDGKTKIDVKLEDNTVWLPQAMIAELYQTSPQNITMHIKSIYEDGELEENPTCKDYLQVRHEAKREVERTVKHYGCWWSSDDGKWYVEAFVNDGVYLSLKKMGCQLVPLVQKNEQCKIIQKILNGDK